MQTEHDITVSEGDAETFARRIGLAWLTPAHIQPLREAMATIARDGLAVPRQPSKFVQPAFTFSVASRADRSTDREQ
jgi:hypothetical protein